MTLVIAHRLDGAKLIFLMTGVMSHEMRVIQVKLTCAKHLL